MENSIEQTTAPVKKERKLAPRPGSRMFFLVNAYKEGVKDIDALAVVLRDAEISGQVKGLKRKDDDFVKSKTDMKFFKKAAIWYLNQAKHKGWVEGQPNVRGPRTKKDVLAKLEEKVNVTVSPVNELPTI
jgi:hypothetical protein